VLRVVNKGGRHKLPLTRPPQVARTSPPRFEYVHNNHIVSQQIRLWAVVCYRAGQAIGKFRTVKRNRGPNAAEPNAAFGVMVRQETSSVSALSVSPLVNSGPALFGSRGFSFNRTRAPVLSSSPPTKDGPENID
jgi:hypothetical protein